VIKHKAASDKVGKQLQALWVSDRPYVLRPQRVNALLLIRRFSVRHTSPDLSQSPTTKALGHWVVSIPIDPRSFYFRPGGYHRLDAASPLGGFLALRVVL
jgi:hypothetical protein